MVVNITR